MADSQRKSYNLFDGVTYNGSISTTSARSFPYATGGNRTTFFIEVEPSTTYTVSFGEIPDRLIIAAYNTVFNPSDYTTENRKNADSMIKETTEGLKTYIFTTNSTTHFVGVYCGLDQIPIDIMFNEGSSAKPYEPYGWVHSLRKLTTATEAVENPLYADGTAITSYTIKGNTVQDGTPTPSNPVEVQGVGNATSNLFNAYNTWTKRTGADVIDIQDNGATISITTTLFCYTSVDVTANTDYILTCTSSGGIARNIAIYKSTSFTTENLIASLGATGGTFNSGNNTKLYILFYASNNSQSATAIYSDVRMNIGNTSQPFEPYGFTIPISSAGQTTPVYLGEVQSTRQIHKIVLDGTEIWSNTTDSVFISKSSFPDLPILSQSALYCTHFPNDTTGMVNGGLWWLRTYGYTDLATWRQYLYTQYAAGTPVTVWYVLETEETGIVNEPLMKIGDYADSISNATSIPTTEGANTITVDTTVQPSEFSATWTGWHDASVKEYDGTDWQ